jgi:hypothetical protein
MCQHLPKNFCRGTVCNSTERRREEEKGNNSFKMSKPYFKYTIICVMVTSKHSKFWRIIDTGYRKWQLFVLIQYNL